MATLNVSCNPPKRFKTWNRFLVSLKRLPDWRDDTKFVIFDDVEYTIEEIKSECFKEIEKIIPERENITNTIKAIHQSRGIHPDNFQWLLDIHQIF